MPAVPADHGNARGRRRSIRPGIQPQTDPPDARRWRPQRREHPARKPHDDIVGARIVGKAVLNGRTGFRQHARKSLLADPVSPFSVPTAEIRHRLPYRDWIIGSMPEPCS
jgi:hypothetical protein